MPRNIIKPHQRGRNKCTSGEGPLEAYYIGLPASLKAWCHKQGPKYIRVLLNSYKVIDEAE